MQKAFSLSRCCNKLLRVGKNGPCAKETNKNKNGLFRMQKAFSLSRCCNKLLRVGKNVHCARETAKELKRFISDAESVFFVPKL